jgi:hypothetical protein
MKNVLPRSILRYASHTFLCFFLLNIIRFFQFVNPLLNTRHERIFNAH